MHALRRVALAVLAVTLAAGCDEITGHPRCDEDVAGPVLDILDGGYQVDCSPSFSSTDQYGVRHHAWTDGARRTVWAWPEQMSDRLLLKVLWHESGHVHGADSEWEADAYAYCHMDAGQRLGIGFLLPWPGCR